MKSVAERLINYSPSLVALWMGACMLMFSLVALFVYYNSDGCKKYNAAHKEEEQINAQNLWAPSAALALLSVAMIVVAGSHLGSSMSDDGGEAHFLEAKSWDRVNSPNIESSDLSLWRVGRDELTTAFVIGACALGVMEWKIFRTIDLMTKEQPEGGGTACLGDGSKYEGAQGVASSLDFLRGSMWLIVVATSAMSFHYWRGWSKFRGAELMDQGTAEKNGLSWNADDSEHRGSSSHEQGVMGSASAVFASDHANRGSGVFAGVDESEHGG